MWGIVLGQFYISKKAEASKKWNAQADICRHKKFEDHIYKKSTCVYIQRDIEVHIQYVDKESVKFILDNVRSHLFVYLTMIMVTYLIEKAT